MYTKYDISTIIYNLNDGEVYWNDVAKYRFSNGPEKTLIRIEIEEIIASYKEKEYIPKAKRLTLNGDIYILISFVNLSGDKVSICILPPEYFDGVFFIDQTGNETEQYYLKLLESMYADFTIINKDGVLEKVMPDFDRVYGINSAEIIGKSIYEIEKDKIFNPCISARAFRSGEKTTALQETLNGEYVMCTSIPIYNSEGEIDKVISYTKNINEYNDLNDEFTKLKEISTYNNGNISNEEIQQIMSRKQINVIGISKSIKELKEMASKIAKFDANVFICGESGVGKNVFAELLHSMSPRAEEPFVSINCGAIPENLMESELFGYEKGAFTGADSSGKAGLIEMANHGTLFLDEICELPLRMQVTLLKVIQEKKITRVGGTKEKTVDFRLITATNKNAVQMVKDGTFREDLYYRLNVLSMEIPPLRERREDIFPLITHFTDMYAKKHKINHSFTSGAVAILEHYDWPGNIRELENMVERILLTADYYVIDEDDLPFFLRNNELPKTLLNSEKTLKEILAELESEVILSAYEKYGTTTKTAEKLGVSQATVSNKVRKYKK